jgi:hypothetical protein
MVKKGCGKARAVSPDRGAEPGMVGWMWCLNHRWHSRTGEPEEPRRGAWQSITAGDSERGVAACASFFTVVAIDPRLRRDDRESVKNH